MDLSQIAEQLESQAAALLQNAARLRTMAAIEAEVAAQAPEVSAQRQRIYEATMAKREKYQTQEPPLTIGPAPEPNSPDAPVVIGPS